MSRPALGRPFYLIMSLVLAAIAILGFSRTLPGDFATPGFPALLWIHAGVFSSWVVLCVAQPALVMNGSLRWHRRLGWVGAGLACAMILLGFAAILLGLWANAVPPFYPHNFFLIRGAAALLVFGGLVVAGVMNRRLGEWHKRLMLCASIIVVVPGLERAMPLFLFGTDWSYVVDGVIDMIALAGPCVDLIERRRIHPAYLWGVGAIVLGQVLVYLLTPTAFATALLHAFGAS
jgi:hypothetical protein